ncbi:hypothetical protein B0H11DRAFT_2288410 [Mycena galericulata]|nr:hypothetical protein B0H11DRAFT_2288410 [Mycena galericulata]
MSSATKPSAHPALECRTRSSAKTSIPPHPESASRQVDSARANRFQPRTSYHRTSRYLTQPSSAQDHRIRTQPSYLRLVVDKIWRNASAVCAAVTILSAGRYPAIAQT